MAFTFGEAPVTMFKNVTRDTYVSNDAGELTFNYGADTEIRIERDKNEHGLIRFDISAVPMTATILEGRLEITFTQSPAIPSTMDLHRVLEPWDEGTRSGTAGEPSYVLRSASTPWMTAGAGMPLSASSPISAFTPGLGRQVIAVPGSVVRQWVDSAGTNHGIVLISTNDDSTRFITSEGTPAVDRPVLTIDFIP